MSAARKVAAVVSEAQAAMLELLRESPGPLSLRDLQDRLELRHTLAQRNFQSLRTRMLVDEVFGARVGGHGRAPMVFVISRSGSRALARHKRAALAAEQVVVAPPTFTTYGQPYVPPHQAYFRNEGNRHIPSRGFSC